jgi:hypothetical protein
VTHDELDWKISHHNYMEAGDLIKALRAVVELHTQDRQDCCPVCLDFYPCPTIQAIESALQ